MASYDGSVAAVPANALLGMHNAGSVVTLPSNKLLGMYDAGSVAPIGVTMRLDQYPVAGTMWIRRVPKIATGRMRP